MKTFLPNKALGRSCKEEQIREKAKQSISTVPLVLLQPHKTLPNTGSLTQSRPELDPVPMDLSLAQQHHTPFLGPSFAVRHTIFKPPICHRLACVTQFHVCNSSAMPHTFSWSFFCFETHCFQSSLRHTFVVDIKFTDGQDQIMGTHKKCLVMHLKEMQPRNMSVVSVMHSV